MLGYVFQLAEDMDNKQQFVVTLSILKQIMLCNFKGGDYLASLLGDSIINTQIPDPIKSTKSNYVVIKIKEEKEDAKEDCINSQQFCNNQVEMADKRHKCLVTNKSAL